jgi:uncharacterized protein YqgV (UPF0045/DUF77 family)
MQMLKLNYMGFVALRNSPGVIADITSRAQRIAEAAGDGFKVTPVRTNFSITGRASVRVLTETAEAMVAEATDRTLTQAIDAGRG